MLRKVVYFLHPRRVRISTAPTARPPVTEEVKKRFDELVKKLKHQAALDLYVAVMKPKLSYRSWYMLNVIGLKNEEYVDAIALARADLRDTVCEEALPTLRTVHAVIGDNYQVHSDTVDSALLYYFNNHSLNLCGSKMVGWSTIGGVLARGLHILAVGLFKSAISSWLFINSASSGRWFNGATSGEWFNSTTSGDSVAVVAT